MIVADQMQEAMHGKMGEMMGERLLFATRLARDGFKGKNDVAEMAGGGIFRRECQHIRGLIDARQSRLRARIAESSVRTIASSAALVDSMAAARVTARRTAVCGFPASFHSSLPTITSIGQRGPRRARHSRRSRFFADSSVVGFDDARDEFVADHVGGGKADMADAFDAMQEPYRVGEPGGLAGRQIDLARIAGHYHPAVLAEPGEQHFHLHRGGVLRLVENDSRHSTACGRA